MKRFGILMVALLMCISIFPCAGAEYSRESFYEMGLTALENMDAESAALAVDHFRAANGYMLAPSYLQYAQSLQDILAIDENSEISMAIFRLQRLQEFPQYDEFAASLKEHQFPSCPDLIIYADGKQLERDGDYAKARRKYEAVSWVLDAMLRSVELTPRVYKQGKRLLEEKQYEAAAAALEGLNWKDSDKLYQQAYRMVHPNAEVVVRYVSEDGTELSSHVITIMPNHTATAQAKSFNGYRLVSNGTVTITVNDYGVATPKEVTFTYKEKQHAGEYVTFGHYPQTTDGTDYSPIEWLVLDVDKDNHKVLLLSRYGLDCQPYHNIWEEVTWENCSLRYWLNDDFLNTAFTSQEQDNILLTSVDNSRSQGFRDWNTYSGNNTQDRVFLLSYVETKLYFDVSYFDLDGTLQSRVSPTDYANKLKVWVSNDYATADGTASGCWWLRSPGYNQFHAATVDYCGAQRNTIVTNNSICVRPALWINMDALDN